MHCRFFHYRFFTCVLLACWLASAQAQTSFGPEISAEDYGQHLWALRATGFGPPGDAAFAEHHTRAYLETQLERLGLQAQEIDCIGNAHGLQVALPSTGSDPVQVLYLAQWQDAERMAALLEVIERFLTQSRPKHEVMFLFTGTEAKRLAKCPGWQDAQVITLPGGLGKLDPAALVATLNALYLQGR